MNPNESYPAWEVTNVTPTAVTNERGQMVEGMNVRIRVADGHEFDVKVPLSQYEQEQVREKAQQMFENYVSVKTLKGPEISPNA